MYRQHIRFLLLFVLLSILNIFPQDTSYYSTVSVSSPTFVGDLQTRIRNPFTSRTYTEFRDIMIPNYESYPISGGQREIICVYSGFVWDYTPPFAFGNQFSREHTYCQSWWDVSSTTNPYYSDFHHLFFTEQPHANAPRSNHPLDDVVNVTSVWMERKIGTNAAGYTVYEPKAKHKGDAARALLYMEMMYDHNGTYGNWSFKWLNETKLPSLSEGPEDISTLLRWAKQDPPDKWEIERNNYIATLQANRNPFVDHPEYMKYINFYDLSKLTPVFSPEPTNQVSSFTATPSGNTITVNWTNPSGAQLPSGYLLLAYNADNYFLPTDGDVYQDSTDLSTGKAIINLPNSAVQSYTFSNLALLTHYYFTIYSFNGIDTLRNYKINPLTRTDATTGSTLPVELISFTASEGKGMINLNWKTATEMNNNGFDIERGTEKNQTGEVIFNKIGFMKGTGNSTIFRDYSFSDKVSTSGKYYYRLKQIDNDGSCKLSNSVEIDFNPLVRGYSLEQNYPNPFNPSTIISYSLPNASNVKISVFNILGEVVRVIENEFKNAGSWQVTFNSDNLNSGTYFYKIEAGQFSQTRKMILVK